MRIFGPLLLVDGRALLEPATHFYCSTCGEKDNLLLFVNRRIIEGFQRISNPVSRAYTMQHLKLLFLSLDDEPIRVSHLSSFIRILPLKQYNDSISMKSIKHKLFYTKSLWMSIFFKYLPSLVLQ